MTVSQSTPGPMTHERLTSDASARELAPLLTAGERAIVSFLATAELYDTDLITLIDGYARETGSFAAAEFSALLAERNSHPLEVVPLVRGLLSQPSIAALQSARANGSLASFYRSWLSQTVNDRVNFVRHEDTHVAAFARLGLKTLFCLNVISVVLLSVVPEFQKMNEEFAIENNTYLASLMFTGDFIAKMLPFLMLAIFLLCLYIVIFKRSIIQNYIRRWLPGRWQQVVLPRSILRRKLMAWDLQGFQSEHQKNDAVGEQAENKDLHDRKDVLNWDFYVSKKLLTASEARIMQSASSLESQAWLLRNMTEKRLENRNARFEVLVRFIVITFQVIIAGFIILTALAVFSSLLEIMRGVGG